MKDYLQELFHHRNTDLNVLWDSSELLFLKRYILDNYEKLTLRNRKFHQEMIKTRE